MSVRFGESASKDSCASDEDLGDDPVGLEGVSSYLRYGSSLNDTISANYQAESARRRRDNEDQ